MFRLFLQTHSTGRLSRLPAALCSPTDAVEIFAGSVFTNNPVWELAAGREAAGAHPLSEALEGEMAARSSWAGSEFIQLVYSNN